MLDSEPDNNSVATTDEAPKRPRRRAASRPAGPPTPVNQAETPPADQPADAQPELPAATEAAPDGAPAKKTASRRTAAKKTTAKKPAAKKTTPRKTAAKKTTAPAPAGEPTDAGEQAGTAGTAPVAEIDAAENDTAENDAAELPAAKRTAARKTAAKKSAAKPAAKRTPRKSAAGMPAAEPAGAVEPDESPQPAEAAEPARAVERTETTPAKTTQAETVQPAESIETTEPAEETAEVDEQAVAAEPSIEAAIASAMNATLAEREQTAPAEAVEPEPDEEAKEGGTAEVAITEEPATEIADSEVAPESETEDQDETDAETGSDETDGHDEGGNRRRRRRRGGRRRRRGRDRDGSADSGDEDSADDTTDTAETGGTADSAPTAATTSDQNRARADGADQADRAEAKSGDQTGDQAGDQTGDHAGDQAGADDDADHDGGDGKRRRRRRRRRRGEDTGGAPDDPSDVVVRVREPRKAASDEVTGIDGSTRMEAKRQRRREGREAGRRRAPIISEAEFLARRESVNRKMIIRQREDLAQIAVLEDGILVEHYVDRESANSLIGNVYLGRVQNVLPSMEAAFIDIGRGRNAVLYAGEVDWDSFGAEGHDRKVENVLKSGQTVLVQVTKDPVGAKGARLTNHVSIPGRYVVYAPGGHLSGISRKLPENERKRLKEILDAAVGETASVIVRTAAEGASEDELTRDVNRLKAQWEDIERKVRGGNAPQLLYAEPDLTLRIVRDLFTEDFSELIVQGNGSMNDAYDALDAYMQHVAPHLADRMKRWDAEKDGDLFGSYRLDEQIAKGLERKVFLPSGGSLIIDRTEAMTVIDVNTGKFTGSGGNLEATITSNNLEAAEEIVRQLRLRDIGGIIVIDFIDMVLPTNRELLLRRLVECLGRDRTRHQVAEVTSLGLVQMTRKRIGTGLLEAFSTECPHCHGRGVELHDMPVADAKMADGGTREDHNSRSGRRRGGKNRKKSSEDAPAEVSAAS